MKVCFIGSSKSYKTSIATYIWSGSLSYHKPTINYQLFSYKEHIIYDCGCSKYYIGKYVPLEMMDLFIIFINPVYNFLDISAEAIYEIIKARNPDAKVMGVVAPTSLIKCIEVAEEIKVVLNRYEITYSDI